MKPLRMHNPFLHPERTRWHLPGDGDPAVNCVQHDGGALATPPDATRPLARRAIANATGSTEIRCSLPRVYEISNSIVVGREYGKLVFKVKGGEITILNKYDSASDVGSRAVQWLSGNARCRLSVPY